jgi:uncharacterized protein
MIVTKEKAINLILLGAVIQFAPLIIMGIFNVNLKGFPSSVAGLISFSILGLFLLGYKYFIQGCCLYVQSKGYSTKLGCLGFLSWLGLSVLLLIPLKNNANENQPFKSINLLELLLSIIAFVFSLVMILGLFCSLNGLNFSDLSKDLGISNLMGIAGCIFFLFKLFIELQENGLKINTIIGYKNAINLKLILAITIIYYGFNRGFNSLNLYNLSFILPNYVENYLNKKSFTNIPEMIYWGISIIVISPFIVELLMRGIILQKWSIKWGVKAGVLSSSLLFAICHFRHDIIPLFIAGVIMSILYFKTRNLVSSILFHCFYNTFVVIHNIMEYFGQSPIERNALITVKNYQDAIQPLLGQRVFLIVISVPFLIYFIYKNFPKNDAIIPYHANEQAC